MLAVLHEQVEPADDRRRHQRDHEAIDRVLDVEKPEVPRHGLEDLARHGPVMPQRVVLDDEREAEGGENRRQWIASEQRPERRHLEHRAEHGQRQHRDDERDPEVAGGEERGRPDVGAQHEEIAVREVDDVHDPEDQGET